MASSTILRRELQGPLPNADVPVLALGGGVTLTAVLRLVREAGIPAYAVCPSKDFARHSRWRRALPGDWEHFSPSQLPALLAAVPLRRAVLIPCSDDWATAVAALPERMAERFPACTSCLATVTAMADKSLMVVALEAFSLPRAQLNRSRKDTKFTAERTIGGTNSLLVTFVKESLVNWLQHASLSVVERNWKCGSQLGRSRSEGILGPQACAPWRQDHRYC